MSRSNIRANRRPSVGRLDTSTALDETYFTQSRRPLAALAFVVPLIIAYELGTWAFHLDVANQTETRIVAFLWVRGLFDALGATGAFVAPLATVAMLLGWHIFARQPWNLRPTVPGAMAGEAFLLAIPLLIAAFAAAIIGRYGVAPLLQAGEGNGMLAGKVILGLGAGVYEELLFRLVGFAVLHSLLAGVLGFGPKATLGITLAITSVAFAGYHHVPGTGEPIAWGSMAFRTAAGVWLGLVFVARGFGLAAGSHAAYDVILVVLPVLLDEGNTTV